VLRKTVKVLLVVSLVFLLAVPGAAMAADRDGQTQSIWEYALPYLLQGDKEFAQGLQESIWAVWDLHYEPDTREVVASIDWIKDRRVDKYQFGWVSVPVRILVDGKVVGVVENDVPLFAPSEAAIFCYEPVRFRLSDTLAPGKHTVTVQIVAPGEKWRVPELEITL